MPTYEYRCPDGHQFESFVQKMSDAKSELPCPTCGIVAQRRMSAGSGFLFKGSGFYITDYGKDGKKDQRDDAAAKATAAAKSESAKSDSAAKPEGGSVAATGAKSDTAAKPAKGAPGTAAASAAPITPPKSSGSKE